jgi:hypothetical protein
MNTRIIYIATSILIILSMVAAVWFFFFRSTGTVSTVTSTDTATSGFGDATNNAAGTVSGNGSTKVNGSVAVNTNPTAAQKIFKIADGPIVGATLIQTLRPTTTLARYIRQDDGHVFDVPLGVAGAVPRVVSNVTIPGGQRAIWLEGGNAALVQYTDDSNIVKTVYLGFPPATTSAVTLPTKLQFLPDGISDIAASPDGLSVVYLRKTTSGSDGYIAKSNGTNSKKLFSLQLSQLVLSWSSVNTILVGTNSAAGIQGILFSVDAKSGSVTQLVTGAGLTATANKIFSQIVYEKSDLQSNATYVHHVKNNLEQSVPFNPIPEKCIWSSISSDVMYCAHPAIAQSNYLDSWHAGTASAPDFISAFNVSLGTQMSIASPGSSDGGVASDILEMSLSPNEHYLSYTTKTARALWGVTLVK